MKKTVSAALALMLSASMLAACGSSSSTTPATTAAAAQTTAAETAAETEAAAEETEAAAEEASFTGSYLMGTGSATGNYYAFGNAMCTVINQVTGANLTVNATGGSTENARLLGSGENEFALIQTDVYSYAHDGIELFDGDPITNFQAITTCYPEMVQIVVRKDSGISSVADMAGKNICVGAVGSGYEVAARQILGAYGMSYDDINETFADQSTAKNGVQDGTFDGMFMCSGYPNSNVTELSLNGNIELVSIDDEHMATLLNDYPFYASFTTETDEYNLGHSVTSVAVKSMLVCLDTFSEDEIYALTKAIYENLGDIQEINAKANYMSLEGALSGIPSDLHPGAAKYYTEQGIEIPDYLK
ncbi:MAG: TAXI family TRAP transporter solute-binding subunit [Clostridiales bacterium]|nr:TAXI family TRAP transporter solute-binding subunit [Clostridiales bacterium]